MSEKKPDPMFEAAMPVVQREAGEGGIITAPRDPDQMRLFAFESGRLEVCVAEFNSVGHWVNCLGN